MNPRRGHICKVNRSSFTVQTVQDSYSGPLFMEIDSTDSSLLVTNQVCNMEYDSKYYPHIDAYVYYDSIGSYFNAERFSANDLSLLGEIQAGTSVLGDRGGN